MENCLATHFDIAVIRCLFVSKWSEEGIFWSVTYLHRRLKGLNFNPAEEPTPRKRSNSLPVPKIEITSHEASQSEQPDKLPHITESILESHQPEERLVQTRCPIYPYLISNLLAVITLELMSSLQEHIAHKIQLAESANGKVQFV